MSTDFTEMSEAAQQLRDDWQQLHQYPDSWVEWVEGLHGRAREKIAKATGSENPDLWLVEVVAAAVAEDLMVFAEHGLLGEFTIPFFRDAAAMLRRSANANSGRDEFIARRVAMQLGEEPTNE